MSGARGESVSGGGQAVFVGATRYTSPLAWLRLAPRWIAMVRQLKRMRGYAWHQVYWQAPFTLGTIGVFASREDLLRFARSRGHRELMGWVVDGTRNATGGYIRVFREVSADALPPAV